MRKQAVLLTLAALEAVAVALFGLFWLVMRPDLLESYGLDPKRTDGRAAPALPAMTRIAFSGWFVGQAVAIGAALVAVALTPWFRTRTRTFLAGSGLVWTVFGLCFAMWAAYAPLFERLAP
jgi:hypothetical protein